MAVEPLKIVYPSHYAACGECHVALALATRIRTQTVRQTAAQSSMQPNAQLQIHCNDWIDSSTLVPNPKLQTAMQAQIKDDNSIISVTGAEVVACPGKALKLSTLPQISGPQTSKER